MNLNEGNPSLWLLNDDNYNAETSDMEVELSPTKYEQLPASEQQNSAKIRRSDEDSSISTSKHRRISEEVSRAIKSYQLGVAMDERRSKSCSSVVRFTIALFLCTLPTIIFSLEMIPGRCKICLGDVELKTYFVASAMLGGTGAMLLKHDCSKYSFARFLGGAVGSLGALFTIWMVMQTLPPINALNVICAIIGIVGAMPGLIVYFLVKILFDECCARNQHDFEDDFGSFTKLMIEER